MRSGAKNPFKENAADLSDTPARQPQKREGTCSPKTFQARFIRGTDITHF